jgi:hypothetical protein
MPLLRPLHRVLIVKGNASSIFPGQSERKFLILTKNSAAKLPVFLQYMEGRIGRKRLCHVFSFWLVGEFSCFLEISS